MYICLKSFCKFGATYVPVARDINAMSRNYCGIFITQTQYARIGFTIEKKIVFNCPTKSLVSKERLWFSCGYYNSILIVIERQGSDAEVLVRAGMLLDLREEEFSSANAFFDFVMYKIYSRGERIRLCNQIRDTLASRSNYRWCGAELESLLHPAIYSNAREINGLAEIGTWMGADGRLREQSLEVHHSDQSGLVSKICSGLEDPGQRKLCALFFPIAIPGSTIFYVGSAPGLGWITALEMIPLVRRVVSFDPRPLTCEKHDARIFHHCIEVHGASDLTPFISPTDDNILVWDVRGDYAQGLKDGGITAEVAELNLMLSDPKFLSLFRLIQIKINLHHIQEYSLPTGGRFYPQPYTLDRDVFELRYVCFIPLLDNYEYFSPTAAMRAELENLLTRLATNYDAFTEDSLLSNLLCSRMRQCNFMTTASVTHAEEEIILFAANRNEPALVLDYLKGLKTAGIRFIISFFTQLLRNEDEFPFPEMELLRTRVAQVCDSRALILAKIEGLYFATDGVDLSVYERELIYSETYLIRSSEFQVLYSDISSEYDAIRKNVSREMGKVFPKFPETFGLADDLISPSGHALRMVLECASGRASLSMFTCKVLANFRKAKKSFVRRTASCVAEASGSANIHSLQRDLPPGELTLERAPNCIWHSKTEWSLGMLAGIRLVPGDLHLEQEVFKAREHVETCINTGLPGMEVSTYLMKRFGTTTPLSVKIITATTDISSLQILD